MKLTPENKEKLINMTANNKLDVMLEVCEAHFAANKRINERQNEILQDMQQLLNLLRRKGD